jgi:hypothetical protein
MWLLEEKESNYKEDGKQNVISKLKKMLRLSHSKMESSSGNLSLTIDSKGHVKNIGIGDSNFKVDGKRKVKLY